MVILEMDITSVLFSESSTSNVQMQLFIVGHLVWFPKYLTGWLF